MHFHGHAPAASPGSALAAERQISVRSLLGVLSRAPVDPAGAASAAVGAVQLVVRDEVRAPVTPPAITRPMPAKAGWAAAHLLEALLDARIILGLLLLRFLNCLTHRGQHAAHLRHDTQSKA